MSLSRRKPMRSYTSSRVELRCASCGGRFRQIGDVREEPVMFDGQLWHALCKPTYPITTEAPAS